MCKFCDVEINGANCIADETTPLIKKGDKVTVEQTIALSMVNYTTINHDKVFVLTTNYWIGSEDNMAELSIPIKYCPFCGRELK